MERKIIKIGDHEISFLECNPASPETIIFIHGNSSSSKTWHFQLNDKIFSGYHMVALDLPGHGNSSDPASPITDYRPTVMANWLSDAIRLFARDKSFFLAGHSLGTNLIAETLPSIPKPKGVTLLSPSVTGRERGAQDIFNPQNGMLFFMDECDLQQVREFFQRELTNDALLEDTIQDFINTRSPFRSTLVKAAMEGYVTDEIQNLREADIPLNIIFGAKDSIIIPGYLNQCNLSVWNEVQLIENAGHYVHLDQPDLLNEALYNYIERN